MKNFLPKNITLIGSLVLAVLIITGGLLLSRLGFFSKEIEPIVGTLSVTGRPSFSVDDSDNDGLLDWEEALWSTDPTNSDTDGDGTPDGEEIETKRDPLIAGPNDALSLTLASINTTQADANTLSGTSTKTQQFAQDFLSRYLLLKQSGVQITQDNVDKYIGPLLDGLTVETKGTWSTSDIRITADTSLKALVGYANTTGGIVSAALQTLREVAAVTQKPLDSLSTTERGAIQKKLSTEKERVSGLVLVNVPKSIAQQHLDILNGLYGIFDSLETFISAPTDPLGGLVSLQDYQSFVKIFTTGFNTLGNTFKKNDIIFTPQDGGYIYINAL
jgi:hypothetical protein